MGIARAAAVVERVDVSAYTVPTETPGADGTLHRDSTTIVMVEAHGGGATGPGCTYAGTATAVFIRDVLTPVAEGEHVMAVPGTWGPISFGPVRGLN